MSSPAVRASRRFPRVPDGEAVGSYESYEAAKHAVDQLVRADFPLQEVSIVGSELRSVERITGRMHAGRAALSGLLSGIMLGVFVGLLVTIMDPTAGWPTLAAVVLVGIGFSVLWNLLGYALSPGKKEFTSVMQVLASHFEVLVKPQLAARARQILGTQLAPTRLPVPEPAAPEQSIDADSPRPRTYGEAQDALRRERGADGQR